MENQKRIPLNKRIIFALDVETPEEARALGEKAGKSK